MSRLNRRRFLTIAAASMALPAYAKTPVVARWQGRALGAGASMHLVGLTDAQAAPIFSAIEQELERLEAIFSLYKTDSEISRLNQDGNLLAPSPELLHVLSLCNALHDATGGVFDPTVQPLWLAIANDAQGPELERARLSVGWQNLQFDVSHVWFSDLQGQRALTLNGVAQGAITDRIAALLKARGLSNILVDMGEIAALGTRADGAEWSVGIADPMGAVVQRVRLTDRAIATSAPRATLIGAKRNRSHIINPIAAGQAQNLISVSAPDAALADGLSTALSLMTPEHAQTTLVRFPQAKIEVAL